MNRRDLLKLVRNSAGGALVAGAHEGMAAAEPMVDGSQTATIAKTADAFLDGLSAAERAQALFAFPMQPVAAPAHFKGGKLGTMIFTGEQYGQSMWSNFPVSDVPRPGLRLGSLSRAQREAAMSLLRVLLSERGYQKIDRIMGSDQALADSGTPYASGRDVYTLAIFGQPSATSPWMVQFGGHHLALNITMKGKRGVLAPVLTGALPATYSSEGQTIRALAEENDKAFALFESFDDRQRRRAIIEHEVSDLVLGPGRDGEMPAVAGLAGHEMTAPQRAMLFDLILEWAGIVNDTYAAPRLAEIRDGLTETAFAWSGPTTHAVDRNGASYFRIQGPKVLIEFSPQRPGGDLTMHVHTIYRDPSNAYGRAMLASRRL